MTTQTAEQPQTAFDEAPLEDAAIQDALERWQLAQDGYEEAREDLRNADKLIQSLISAKSLEEGTYRCGRFIVAISDVAAHQRVRPKIAKNKTA